MSTLSLEFILETDYDGFLRFCEQQHCAETVRFWSDAQDFRNAMLSRTDYVEPPPPPPKPSLPTRASRVLTKSFRKTLLTPRTSSLTPQFATSTGRTSPRHNSSRGGSDLSDATFARHNSMLSVDTSPVSTKSSMFNRRSFFPTSNDARNVYSFEDRDNDIFESSAEIRAKLMPFLMTGSSVMRIEMSMTKNLADKLRIERADVVWFELAQSIFIKYFDVNSPSQICISPEISDTVEENLHAGYLTPELFKEAQQAAYFEMKTSLLPAYLHKMWVSIKDLPAPPAQQVEGVYC